MNMSPYFVSKAVTFLQNLKVMDYRIIFDFVRFKRIIQKIWQNRASYPPTLMHFAIFLSLFLQN